MEQRQIVVTAEAFAEARALLDGAIAAGLGGERFVRAFRSHCELFGWDWFGLEPRQLFNWRAMSLFRAASYARYCAGRRKELSGSALWIFKAEPGCPDEHQQLDGIVLPPEHEFWRHYAPPLTWQCGCHVVGAGLSATAKIMGGKLDKPLPEWWNKVDPETELRLGIEEPWSGEEEPDLSLLIAAIVDGHIPQPE